MSLKPIINVSIILKLVNNVTLHRLQFKKRKTNKITQTAHSNCLINQVLRVNEVLLEGQKRLSKKVFQAQNRIFLRSSNLVTGIYHV